MPRHANTLTRMHISASQQLRGTRSHSGHTFRIIRLRCHRATHRVTDTVGLLYYTPLRLRMRTLVVSVSVHTLCLCTLLLCLCLCTLAVPCCPLWRPIALGAWSPTVCVCHWALSAGFAKSSGCVTAALGKRPSQVQMSVLSRRGLFSESLVCLPA